MKWPFGGEGLAKDVLIPSGAAIVQISELMGQTEGKAGEYSFGGQAKELPQAPGLVVDGVGSIHVQLLWN
ncbi:hypothetical protein GN244_ATG16252 [Phytophthora infestans]|uniref:Uncharacterized protein n=1 Tax=Phytophthora infestans TaxID=4787 RepID=A0A833VWM0_PHYIN|nr:hypothetical protein GN244_ATG16252 [Phytophthora infestans]